MGLFWRHPPSPSFPALPAGTSPVQVSPPFVVEDRLEEVKSNGAFTPYAALWLSPSLGESGLLSELSSGELHLLLGVLSCLSPNGTFLATSGRVAGALGLPHRVARQGLEALCQRLWHGLPLLHSHSTPTGMRFFAPSLHLLEARRSVIAPAPTGRERVQTPDQPQEPGQQAQGGRAAPGGAESTREVVVAHSRALYGRPRAEVEAEIEAFLASGRAGRVASRPSSGITAPPQIRRGAVAIAPEQPALSEAEATPEPAPAPPETTILGQTTTSEAREWLALKRALVEMGVPDYRAGELLDTYPIEVIRRQMEWLPLRGARNPVAYLLAAIEGDYQAPVGYQAPKSAEAGTDS